jgi:transglutaminase-like putative cysteine protease
MTAATLPVRGRALTRAALGVRLASVGALALFSGLQWATLVAPGAGGTMVLATALGAAGALAVAWAGRRWVTAAVVVVLVPLGLLVAGASVREVLPGGWDGLASRIGDGLNALPGIQIPYASADASVRLVLLGGGVALVVVALVAAAAPRRGRAVSLAALIVVFAVPATETSASSPYLRGAVFAVLLAAVLWGERLAEPGARGEAPLAAVLVGLAVVAGLALGPGLDTAKPWINWDTLINDIAKGETEQFSWDHTYGPFDWPRDGRVVLRVKAAHSAYWKAANLDGFDGRRWVAAGLRPDAGRGGADVVPRPRWEETIRVTLAGMRTDQLIGAGSTLALDRLRLPASPVGSPGTWAVVGQLHRGDAYQARVYVPQPTPRELARAGTAYPDVMELYRSVRLPVKGGDPAGGTEMVFYPFGAHRQPAALGPSATLTEQGDRVLATSPYARTYALARRLRAGAATPYDYVRRVESYLDSGRYRYDERVPRHAVPLEGFLFADHRGYCQQFSGAMALLLRMGGIPARVAAGFSPGAYDAARREYVVRDIDAHSWVEAYFPRYGWVTFDPTPAIAPARAQVGLHPGLPGSGRGSDGALGGRVADPKAGGPSPAGSSPPASFPVLPVLGAAAALGVLALLGIALARRVTRPRPRVAPELAELDRALRRTGWRPDAPVTLRRLETSFAAQPGAAGYVRAVREARYGYGTGPPTSEHRRGLRRALAADRSLTGWLRALWALPPVLTRTRRPPPS